MRNYRSPIAAVLLTVMATALPSLSFAGPVTWKISGNVVANDVGGGSYWTDLGVDIGDTVSAQVTFDPTAAAATAVYGTDVTGGTTYWSAFNAAFASIYNVTVDGASYDPNYVNPLARLRLNLDSTVANFGLPTTEPFDTFSIDLYEQGFQRLQVLRIAATPAGDGTIPQTYFPSMIPDLNDLMAARYYIQELDGNGVTSGLMTYWTSVEQVPEPGMMSLLLISLLGLRFNRRRT